MYVQNLQIEFMKSGGAENAGTNKRWRYGREWRVGELTGWKHYYNRRDLNAEKIKLASSGNGVVSKY